MRPRVFPAEDGRTVRATSVAAVGFNEAAGIPRGRPGSSAASRRCPRCFNEAAGIPRGRPPQNSITSASATSFNEAAGIPRGRRAASQGSFPSGLGFNEAAGIPRGRPCRCSGRASRSARFNEAAGIPRGRQQLGFDPVSVPPVASMRPRVFPAEDTAVATVAVAAGVVLQ